MKWEYDIGDFVLYGYDDKDQAGRIQRALQAMNGYGRDGWEAVNAWTQDSRIVVFFKRPVSK